jgi:hypothetical protein
MWALVLATLLAAAGCTPKDDGDACEANEDVCDGVCVPAGAVCCGNGDGAICPPGYECGTFEDPCIPIGGEAGLLITISGGAPCPDFSPNPSSVSVGEPFSFTNQTSETVTIVGRQASPPWPIDSGLPWTSLAPGETSGGLAFDTAGNYSYASTTHLGSCDTRWGELFVTVD